MGKTIEYVNDNHIEEEMMWNNNNNNKAEFTSLLEVLEFNRVLGKYRIPENFEDSLMKSYISVLMYDTWFDTLIEIVNEPYVIGNTYIEADESYVMLANDVKIFINTMNEVVFVVRYKGKLIACEDDKMTNEEKEYLNSIYDTIIKLVEYKKNNDPVSGTVNMPKHIKIPQIVINNKARRSLLYRNINFPLFEDSTIRDEMFTQLSLSNNDKHLSEQSMTVQYKLDSEEPRPMDIVKKECIEIVNARLEADAYDNDIKSFKLIRRKQHALVVANLCIYMTKHINKKIDKEDKKIDIDTMFLAGVLHDLCKFECNDMHDILSAVRSKDILTDFGYPKMGTEICFIIKEHSNKIKQKKIDLRQQILKEADILSHLALTYFDCIVDVDERIDDIDKIIDEVTKLKPIFRTNVGLKLYKKMMRNLKTYSRDLVDFQLYNK